jgi:hypothetical protein
MARHTVPQDVETADKLIGFLSLKQFIFVLVGCGLLFIAYTFANVNILLGIPFLPFIFVAFVLGLYQRHDQPVEVFLAAWLKFKLAPKSRVWNQEGYEEHVIVTAPKKEVIDYTKGMTGQDVANKLTGLGIKLDTKGWSTKGVLSQDSVDLGTGESERLLSLSSIEEIKKKYEPQQRSGLQPISDIFDANNSPTASLVEVDVDKASIRTQEEASRILSLVGKTAAPAVNQPNTLDLKENQLEEVKELANSTAPISTVAQQAGATINLEKLDQAAEFSLR